MKDEELSCFFVRELYSLHVEGVLDQIRKKKIESHLNTCKECKTYYTKLDKARTQILTLVGTKAASGTIQYLKSEHHFWNDLTKHLKWNQWPATLKWVAELSLVTVGLIVTIHYFPWLKLARVVQTMRPAQQVVAVMNTPAPVSEPQEMTKIVAISQLPEATPEVVAINAPKSNEQEDEEDSQTAGVLSSDNEQKMAGFVWRGSLKVEELTDDVALRVTKTITDLGGTKAGQVELGWHRGKQRYYHFILPEENYEKFLSVLNTEGLVQLTKERHPRTIRAGHMRIIMTVEETEE